MVKGVNHYLGRFSFLVTDKMTGGLEWRGSGEKLGGVKVGN